MKSKRQKWVIILIFLLTVVVYSLGIILNAKLGHPLIFSSLVLSLIGFSGMYSVVYLFFHSGYRFGLLMDLVMKVVLLGGAWAALISLDEIPFNSLSQSYLLMAYYSLLAIAYARATLGEKMLGLKEKYIE
jgi:hypothetical protein